MRKLHSLSKVALASTMLLTAGTGLTLAIDRNNEKNQSQPVKAPVYESPVIKLRHGQGGQYDYVPNEVIVKFKDSSNVKVQTTRRACSEHLLYRLLIKCFRLLVLLKQSN